MCQTNHLIKPARYTWAISNSTVLQAKQINHGQSELWLEANGQELTPYRTLATNEVVNVVRRNVTEDVSKAFYAEYHVALEHIASLTVADLDVIATELKLKL